MALLPKVKLKTVPIFPSNIVGGTGLTATKTNGALTLDFAWQEFGAISAIPTSPTSYLLTYDTATNAYVMVPSHLLGGGVSGIADAPNDGVQYGRQSGAWTTIASSAIGPATVPPLMDGTAAVGTSPLYARQDHVHPSDTSRASVSYVDTQDALRAPLASPVFTGDPRAPTPVSTDNDTSIATTAFVKSAVAAVGGVTLGNPTNTIGLTAVNGSGSTALYSNSAPALSQAIAPTWTGAHAWSYPSISSSASLWSFNIGNDGFAAGAANFYIPIFISTSRNGGTGHRELMHVTHTGQNAPGGTMNVPAQFASYNQSGDGLYFGLNTWTGAYGLNSGAEHCALEANTHIVSTSGFVSRKVGIQIVDASEGSTPSTGSGHNFDAGMIIGCQPNNAGYSTGIRFGFADNNGELGIYGGGSLISTNTNTVPVGYGLKLDGMNNFQVAPIVLPAGNKGVYFGASKQGGAVVSETGSGAGDIAFGSGATAIRFGGTVSCSFVPQGIQPLGLVSHQGTGNAHDPSHVINFAFVPATGKTELWIDNVRIGTINTTP